MHVTILALVLLTIISNYACDSDVRILGIGPADDSVTVDKKGSLAGFTGSNLKIVVFGTNIQSDTKVAFSQTKNADSTCARKRESLPRGTSPAPNSTSFVIEEFFEKPGSWFLCRDDAAGALWPISSQYVTLTITEDGNPGWILGLEIAAVSLLLALSGLFSGLNLGLMSLNADELQVVKNVGSESEKKYAAQILPIRKHGNFLLCTLLLGNVIVNTTATILLDSLTGSGLAAVFGSAAGIVVFGEIVPQSVCTRHGLAIGAKTIWLTKTFMVLTAIVSWPLSKLLDCVFGEEIGQKNNRDKFVEMAKMSQQKGDEHFDPNTVAIIDGAFQLKEKSVKDVMTPIDKVFMIDYNDRLTFELTGKISEKGFTRIPVFKKEDNTRNIVGIIFVKDLMFIDPGDNMPIKAICDHTNHQLMFTYEEVTLDQMLAEFKTGSSHMAIVQKPVSVPGMDPYYEITGVITLEDVIEEMIGSEIIDETDYFVDNTGRHRANRHRKMDFKAFMSQQTSTVFPAQLKLFCYQFLHSEIESFGPSIMHSSVLKKLMECNVLFEIKLDNSTTAADDSHILYKKDVPSEYFIMILEGRALISVGKTDLKFEAGPLHYFGEPLLRLNPTSPVGGNAADESGGAGSMPPPSPLAITSIPNAIGGKQNNNMTSVADTSLSNVNSKSTQNSITTPAHIPQKDVAYFIPDFTLTATTNLVIFKINQKYYAAAVKASKLLFEKEELERNNSAADDGESKTIEEYKEMVNVGKILSDELSKVDSQVRVMNGNPFIAPPSPIPCNSNDNDANMTAISNGNGNDDTDPTKIRFVASGSENIAPNDSSA